MSPLNAPTSRPLTVGDLLDEPALGLSLVSAAPVSARVRAAHAIEIEHPGPWLKPGSVMLTTGLRFVGRPPDAEAATALVAELAGADVAALLFGVGVHFEVVPREIVYAASAAGLPVLAVRADVPFLQIEDFVNAAVHGGDSYPLRRMLWLQNDLLQALADAQPVPSLTARLASLVKGTAVFYEESGRPVASVGGGPTRLIWTEIQSRPSGRQAFGVGRFHVLTRPFVVRGVGYWLALATQRRSLLDETGDALLESAQRIFAALSGVRALGQTQARAEASHLLRQLHDGVTTEEEARIWDRLRGFRFSPRQPVRVFVATPRVAGMPRGPEGREARGSRADSGESLLASLHEEAQLTGIPLVFHDETDELDEVSATAGEGVPHLRGLVGEVPALDDWLGLLAATHDVGLSEAFADLVSAPRVERAARRAARVAVRRGTFAATSGGASSGADAAAPSSGMIVRFEDVDLATWLLSARGQSAIAAKVSQQLAPLLDRPDLVETAIVWLGSGLDIQASAEALFLHPNSVRYRLRRIEELLQAPIFSPTVIANLYLAFHDRLAPH